MKVPDLGGAAEQPACAHAALSVGGLPGHEAAARKEGKAAPEVDNESVALRLVEHASAPRWRSLPRRRQRSSRSSLRLGMATAAVVTLQGVSTILSKGLLPLFGVTVAIYSLVMLAQPRDVLRRVYRALFVETDSVLLVGWTLVVFVTALLGRGKSSDMHLLFEIIALVMFWLSKSTTVMGRGHSTVVYAATVALGAINLVAIPSLLRDASLSRDYMDGRIARDSAEAFGVGDVYIYNGYAIVLPVMLAISLGLRGWKRAVGVAACGCILVATVVATYAASFAIAIVGMSLLAVWPLLRSSYSFVGKVMWMACLVGFVAAAVVIAKDLTQIGFASSKLARIVQGVSSEGVVAGDETGRGGLVSMSFDTFLSNPFLGIGPYSGSALVNEGGIGGHCSWVDQLAEYGVLGFGVYAVFFVVAARRLMRAFMAQPTLRTWSSLVSVALFAVAGAIDPVLMSYLVAPLFYFVTLGAPDCAPLPQGTM